MSEAVVGPAPFVTIELAAKITGYSELAIERKIERGVWRQGLEWFKAPDGRRLISMRGYERWRAGAGRVKPATQRAEPKPSVAAGATALYRHFSKDGDLLYVGVSLAPANRLAGHARSSGWAADIASVTVSWFPTRAAALSAERDAIKTEGPMHNIVHRERRGAS